MQQGVGRGFTLSPCTKGLAGVSHCHHAPRGWQEFHTVTMQQGVTMQRGVDRSFTLSPCNKGLAGVSHCHHAPRGWQGFHTVTMHQGVGRSFTLRGRQGFHTVTMQHGVDRGFTVIRHQGVNRTFTVTMHQGVNMHQGVGRSFTLRGRQGFHTVTMQHGVDRGFTLRGRQGFHTVRSTQCRVHFKLLKPLHLNTDLQIPHTYAVDISFSHQVNKLSYGFYCNKMAAILQRGTVLQTPFTVI